MPVIRFAVQRRDGKYWGGSHFWPVTSALARGFDTYLEAEYAGLRELPDPVNTWQVVVIPEHAYAVVNR